MLAPPSRSATLAVSFLSTLWAVGCADPQSIELGETETASHTVRFVGNVYDGVNGGAVTTYEIGLAVADVVQEGTVDETGRYTIGPIGAWEDYSATITAGGYRAFVSHNAYVGLPPAFAQSDDIAEISTNQTLHFDAYLFPSDLESPASLITIETPVGSDVSGKIRFRPASPSVLTDDPFVETPVGVGGQLWFNDADLLSSVVSAEFSGGTYDLEAGSLVYGVTYQVDVFDVAGFQPFSDTFVAGVESGKTFTLTEEIAEPLEVVSSTAGTCTAPMSPTATTSAVVTIELNANIEEGDSGYAGGAAEALDDGISFTQMDDAMAPTNTLATDASDTAQERGVSFTINGSTVTISWNPSEGLATSDPNDTIVDVTYSQLADVVLQRVGSPSSAQSLSALLGQTTITCD